MCYAGMGNSGVTEDSEPKTIMCWICNVRTTDFVVNNRLIRTCKKPKCIKAAEGYQQ